MPCGNYLSRRFYVTIKNKLNLYMKKILLMAAVGVMALTGCEDFLDSQNYTKKDSSNFPVNETDAQQLLTAVYGTLNSVVSNCGNSYFYVAEAASDDRFGGGGENDKDFQCVDHLMYANIDRFSTFWTERYKGVNRANMAIENLVNVADETLRNQKMGEALFLRAFSYFELTQMFGDVPFIESAPADVTAAQVAPAQMKAEEIYKYIASDLKAAYEMMPSYKWNEVNSGTVTKWAAAGLLGRVYLFYTGFYGKNDLPLPDGSTISKTYVADALKDCIDNSGHSLVPDYRSLWAYTNKLSKKDDKCIYAKDADEWVKDGENPEQVFAIKMAYLGGWPSNGVTGYSNQYCLFFAPRSTGAADQYENLFPFGQGWGAAPVNPGLWDEWKAEEPNDIRREASILDVSTTTNYVYGGDKAMEESGFWQKKYVAIRARKADGSLFNSFTSSADYYGDGEKDDFQCSHSVDLTVIRYADILLMHSELTETADGINAVRGRVGLDPISYSLDALKKERRHELAFEGVRWGDIRRWGDAESALVKQVGQTIYNRGIETTMKDQGAGYVARYQATKGFMPIPNSEIELSAGALKQNAGWDNSNVYVSWNE